MQSVEAVRNTLSEEQQTIVTEVFADFDAGRRQTYLIHGITGSGKTEVYMQLIGEMIARGRQAIVLIPEIALTFTDTARFYQRFGDRVSVMNSTLSPGEKIRSVRTGQSWRNRCDHRPKIRTFYAVSKSWSDRYG